MMGQPRGLLALAALLLTLAGPAGAEWGWLGIRIRDLSEREMEDLIIKHGLDEGYGVVVVEVLKGTPAEAAGLRAGDLIVAIRGRPVVEVRGLQRTVGATSVGREVTLTVLRAGERRDLRARIGAMPAEVVAERIAAEFGFAVREPPGELDPPPAGPPAPPPAGLSASAPVVAAVAEASAAARGGLRAGDQIVQVKGVPVASLEAFRQRLRQVSLHEPLTLTVVRKGEPHTLRLPPPLPPLPPH